MTKSPTSIWEWLARAGYGARGVVYLSAGLFSLLAALEMRQRTEGAAGAIEALAGWPFGQFWIAAIGIGLWAFVAWRFAQAVLDADRLGTSLKAIVSRVGQALSGLVYAALAWSALGLLDGLEDDGRPGTAELLALPLGDKMLLAAGAAVAACGVGHMVRAFVDDFVSGLDCTGSFRRRAERLARAGYFARGVAVALLGVFLMRGALNKDGGDIQDLGAALQSLESQPFGSWLLAAVAAGLIAFGLFGLVEARHRRIVAPRTNPRSPLRPVRTLARLRARSAPYPARGPR